MEKEKEDVLSGMIRELINEEISKRIKEIKEHAEGSEKIPLTVYDTILTDRSKAYILLSKVSNYIRDDPRPECRNLVHEIDNFLIGK